MFPNPCNFERCMRALRVAAGSVLSVLLISRLAYAQMCKFPLGYLYCWRPQWWSSVLPWPPVLAAPQSGILLGFSKVSSQQCEWHSLHCPTDHVRSLGRELSTCYMHYSYLKLGEIILPVIPTPFLIPVDVFPMGRVTVASIAGLCYAKMYWLHFC